MNLDQRFKNDFKTYVDSLANSKDVKYSAQNIIDEQNKYGNDIEDIDIVSDAMNEDFSNMLRNYVISLINENPNEIWNELCSDIPYIRDYAYGSEKLIDKYFGNKNIEKDAKNNGDYYYLADAMQNIIMSVYVDTQGGWFDNIADAYYNAVLNKYDELVANLD